MVGASPSGWHLRATCAASGRGVGKDWEPDGSTSRRVWGSVLVIILIILTKTKFRGVFGVNGLLLVALILQ